MSKRVVVITGGGSGMGRAIAHRFAEAGDTVYIIGRRLKKLEETARGHSAIHCVEADATDVKAVESACRAILGKHKTVDILINNAGGAGPIEPNRSLSDSLAAWQAVINKNLTTAFLMTHALRPHITRPGGRIIFISSIAAIRGSGQPGGEGYAAAKAGLHGFMRTLVRQLSADGITLNTIAPGFIGDTEFFKSKALLKQRAAEASKSIPVGRVGTPEEIAAAAFYLASSEAGFVNGDILNINGGVQFGR